MSTHVFITTKEIMESYLKKRAKKMGKFIDNLGEQVGGGLVSQGMGMLFGGYNRSQQRKQQQKFTDMQTEASKDLMKAQKQTQMEIWDETNYAAQMQQMRKAGLNPAMIYANGGGEGAVGSVGGGSAGSGGHASDEASMMQADTARQGMGLQRNMMEAQIDMMKSQAEKNRADANLSGEMGTTESEKRSILLENMKQAGTAQWMENLRNDLLNSGVLQQEGNEMILNRNSTYNVSTAFQKTGQWNEQVTTAIAKTMAETSNTEMNELLTNNRAKGYWQELMNATKDSDSRRMQAEAMKLASEWGTGEFTNWKTWTTLAENGLGLVFDGVKAFTPAGKAHTTIESMTKNINLPSK